MFVKSRSNFENDFLKSKYFKKTCIWLKTKKVSFPLSFLYNLFKQSLLKTTIKRSLTPAGVSARMIFETFYKDTLPPCSNSSNARYTNLFMNSSSLPELKSFYLGNNIPNPFTGKTIIPYVIPMETEEAYISIHDVFGKLVGTYKINPVKTQIEVSLTGFESGVYYYSLTLNGEISETKKMVLIK